MTLIVFLQIFTKKRGTIIWRDLPQNNCNGTHIFHRTVTEGGQQTTVTENDFKTLESKIVILKHLFVLSSIPYNNVDNINWGKTYRDRSRSSSSSRWYSLKHIKRLVDDRI